MRTRTLAPLLPLALAGCFSAEAPRFPLEPTVAAERVRTSADTISIVGVSLPSYAKEMRIPVRDESGAVVPLADADWADEPERAMTSALIRHLSDISQAEVAAEPWPLGGVPEAEVRVRVEQMVADRSGIMTLAGQYSIRRDASTSRNEIEQFSIRVTARTDNPQEIVLAHDVVWRDLASLIAKRL